MAVGDALFGGPATLAEGTALDPEPGTVTFLELALDFEEFAERTLPHSPQAKFKGTTLSQQERGRVLRLAVANAQRLVTKGHLHPARVVTRCSSLVPLGGQHFAA